MLPKKIVLNDDDTKENKEDGGGKRGVGKDDPGTNSRGVQKPKLLQSFSGYEPTGDDIGDPIWPVTVAELSKAFRRSLLTHPDKNPGDKKAREAFDVLSECHQKLKNEETKREALSSVPRRRSRGCVRTIPSYARERRNEGEKKEAGDFQTEIKRQREEGMEKRKERRR